MIGKEWREYTACPRESMGVITMILSDSATEYVSFAIIDGEMHCEWHHTTRAGAERLLEELEFVAEGLRADLNEYYIPS